MATLRNTIEFRDSRYGSGKNFTLISAMRSWDAYAVRNRTELGVVSMSYWAERPSGIPLWVRGMFPSR